ncbi:SDR family NAD(P)-dependent oxidoreductase [Parasphingorhabdus cellanae]|uniref:SDR family oxidoreductase n=1 Tax=Parasphingorhabdus cellanae TaxID=2806553 RepID=A0ABX7T8P1_9SPHN|nr:SDR family oxidoreductase [Parasphingorhabdus cellanae]QTD57273.1 SDR family oxidoreductase [Parasphingorhabdus cellanae]
MKLEENIALVTGGAGGIGQAICAMMISEGAKAIVADRDLSAARGVAQNLGDQAIAVELNVASAPSWLNALSQIETRFPRLDILVNSAGVSGFGNIDQIDFEFWKRFQEVNSDSVFLSVKHCLPMLRKAKAASIINIGSTQGLQPNPNLPAYSASKGALRALTKSLALHFADNGDNIRCNAIHPGSTLTPMMEANLGKTEEERQRNYDLRIQAHPLGKVLGRIVLPEDIAKAALFLASNDAEFITGIDLPVDGGATAFC